MSCSQPKLFALIEAEIRNANTEQIALNVLHGFAAERCLDPSTIRALRARIADLFAETADTLRVAPGDTSFEGYCAAVGLASEGG
jgi:hypothetical protein